MAKEIYRQGFHILGGVLLVILIYYDVLNFWSLSLVLLSFFLFFLTVKVTKGRFFKFLINLLEREHNIMKFPGLGVLTFLMGSLIAIFFFNKDIALASILILSVGDSLSTLIGPHGRFKYFNPKKNWEGLIAGALGGALAATVFVSFWYGLIAASSAMLIEGLDLKFLKWKIDDNFIVPVISGLVLSLLIY